MISNTSKTGNTGGEHCCRKYTVMITKQKAGTVPSIWQSTLQICQNTDTMHYLLKMKRKDSTSGQQTLAVTWMTIIALKKRFLFCTPSPIKSLLNHFFSFWIVLNFYYSILTAALSETKYQQLDKESFINLPLPSSLLSPLNLN